MRLSISQIIRVIRYEFRESLSYCSYRIFVAIILLYYIAYIVIDECGQSVSNLGFLDCIIYTFRGTPPYDRTANQPFTLPILYILFQSYLLLLVNGLVSKNNIAYCKQVLLFTKSRKIWWIGKLWTGFLYSILYFLLYLLLLWVIYQKKYDFIWESHGTELWGGKFSSLPPLSLTFALLLPLFSSISNLIMFFTLELIFSQVVGFLITMGLLLLSSYSQNSLLLGNYMMFIRTDILTEQSLSLRTGYLIIIVYMLIFALSGFIYMNKTDILN